MSRSSVSSHSHLLLGCIVLALLLAATPTRVTAADVPPACTPIVARIVSMQGVVEMRRAGQRDWAAVTRLDTPVCQGDVVHSGPRSRAALVILPEKFVRLDQNSTVSISIDGDETVVEFFQDETTPKDACGAGYFITRFPRKFKVRTPFVNAAVEGTEFLVSMSCTATSVAVFEGKVSAETLLANAERFILSSGETLSAGPGEAPAIKVLVKPVDAVQWALYYPPLSTPGPGVGPDQQCDQSAPDEKSRCLMLRAEQRLRVGRVDEAQSDIDASLKLVPDSSDANALLSVIDVAKNDKQRALALAQHATQLDPINPRGWIALSYAQQASFKLEDALANAQRAAELEPRSSIALTRVADLLMSLGKIRSAQRAAQAAVDANPDDSRAHTILGFVHLAEIDIKEARGDFEAAIALDSSDPLPRLGLGLAIIRSGNLTAGREQIEIAVALDPTNSLLRSYVGKAYYEENTPERDKLAATQFSLAEKLDAKDPTPWFYEAILKESQNRPIEALEDLRKSIELNDDRAVYRSRLLLDDDSAARNASVSAVYGELGFERLAVLESTQALSDNFGNSSAHRLLADAYANLPRFDIARVSEALQAQIRQPLTVPPVDPQISTDHLAILRDTGPSRLGANEYNLLFNRDQARVQFDALGASRETWGDQLVVSGLSDRLAYQVSQLHYETGGFQENDAAQKNVYDAFVQVQLSPAASVQIDAKHSDFALGQTFFAFDPVFTNPTTITEKSDSGRISGRYASTPGSDWIWSVAYDDRERLVQTFPGNALLTRSDANIYSAELQNLIRSEQVQIVSGLAYISQYEHFPVEQIDVNTEAGNVYTYIAWRPPKTGLNLEVGVSAEAFSQRYSSFSTLVDRSQLSPKLGVTWSPVAGTTLRAAAFTSVDRPLINSQTLEPTQVAGFNQFFTGFEQFFGDIEGTISRRVGIALDQAFSRSTFAGIEVTSRRLSVPSAFSESDYTWREHTAQGYLYKMYAPQNQSPLPGWGIAASVQIEYEAIERPQIFSGTEGIVQLHTTRVPFGVGFFNANGITIRLGTAYVAQSGRFSIDEGFPVVPKSDHAWITDVSLEYQLPNRLGYVALGVRNLFNTQLDLLEIDPLTPRVATGRLMFARARLVF